MNTNHENTHNRLPTLRLDELERMAIEDALEATRGNRVRAARLLGIHVRTLHRKLVAAAVVATPAAAVGGAVVMG